LKSVATAVNDPWRSHYGKCKGNKLVMKKLDSDTGSGYFSEKNT